MMLQAIVSGERVFQISQAARYVAEFAQTFEAYPQRQKPASWGIEKLTAQIK